VTALLREFRDLPATDGYALDVPEAATELRVERLRRERGVLMGELTVSCGLPGTRSASGVLSVADFNLSSAQVRRERASVLVERSQAPELDWPGLLEDFCQRVIVAERVGQPAVMLRDLPRPNPDEDVEVDPGFPLLRRHPVTLFGDGGSAKSYLGLYAASRLALAGWRVLFADWEFSGEDHRDRLERICGPIMPELWYARCERPMTSESDRLRRIVREHRLDYLICDSIAFAADGPPEAAEVAAGYFRALRRIGVGSLNIAHTNRSETGDQKPFGSTFWHNGSRATWFVKLSDESTDRSRITVGLFNRKANTGRRSDPIGYSIAFDDERTTFTSVDVASTPDLAAKLPVWRRMAHLLGAGGAMTLVEIAGGLEEPVETVKKAAQRGDGKLFAKVIGADGIYRIGLALRDAS